MKRIIILFGAPGCGKGTLGEFLKTELIAQGKYPAEYISYVSTGDLLREEIASGSELGKEISAIVQSGGLVSDEIVEKLIAQSLNNLKHGHLMFLDGFPRTMPQLEALSAMLDKSFHVTTIKRDTDEKVIKERISKRRVCTDCKHTHIATEDGKCPKCGGQVTIRKDDAVIDKRLAEYHANTEPIWNYMAIISKTVYTVKNNFEAVDAAKEFIKKHF